MFFLYFWSWSCIFDRIFLWTLLFFHFCKRLLWVSLLFAVYERILGLNFYSPHPLFTIRIMNLTFTLDLHKRTKTLFSIRYHRTLYSKSNITNFSALITPHPSLKTPITKPHLVLNFYPLKIKLTHAPSPHKSSSFLVSTIKTLLQTL